MYSWYYMCHNAKLYYHCYHQIRDIYMDDAHISLLVFSEERGKKRENKKQRQQRSESERKNKKDLHMWSHFVLYATIPT